MHDPEIEIAMQRAMAADGVPCHVQISPPNLQTIRTDGWRQIGTVTIPAEWKAWLVYWQLEHGRGWLWAIR